MLSLLLVMPEVDVDVVDLFESEFVPDGFQGFACAFRLDVDFFFFPGLYLFNKGSIPYPLLDGDANERCGVMETNVDDCDCDALVVQVLFVRTR